jgi:hypothetical protein
VDLVFGQKFNRFNIRFTVDNLTDSRFLFTQGAEDQRVFKLGRTVGLSIGLSVF